MTTSIEDRVTTVIRACLPVWAQAAEVDPDSELLELGLDSLGVAALVVALEREFGVSFPADLITRETFRSLGTTQRAIRGLLGTSADHDASAG